MAPAFIQAARRHLKDAELLYEKHRFDNADHLAGLAYECALKACLALDPAVRLNAKGFLEQTDKDGNVVKTFDGHADEIWRQVAPTIDSKAAKALAPLYALRNPFAAWRITQRYEASRERAATDAARTHIEAAAAVVGAWSKIPDQEGV